MVFLQDTCSSLYQSQHSIAPKLAGHQSPPSQRTRTLRKVVQLPVSTPESLDFVRTTNDFEFKVGTRKGRKAMKRTDDHGSGAGV